MRLEGRRWRWGQSGAEAWACRPWLWRGRGKVARMGTAWAAWRGRPRPWPWSRAAAAVWPVACLARARQTPPHCSTRPVTQSQAPARLPACSNNVQWAVRWWRYRCCFSSFHSLFFLFSFLFFLSFSSSFCYRYCYCHCCCFFFAGETGATPFRLFFSVFFSLSLFFSPFPALPLSPISCFPSRLFPLPNSCLYVRAHIFSVCVHTLCVSVCVYVSVKSSIWGKREKKERRKER